MMNLDALDGVPRHQTPPKLIGGRLIWEHADEPLDHSEPALGFRETEAKPSPRRGWPGAPIPELGYVLRGGDGFVPACPQGSQRLTDGRVVGVGAVEQPQENAGVREDLR